MEGWIKLHRNIANWRWATSPNHMTLFMQILIRANYKESSWRKETIMPGQLLTGTKQLVQWTGLSEMQIRRCLRDLAATSEITIKTTNKFSIISITNWGAYQEIEPQATNKEQTKNKQVTTSKKDNKYNKEKNNNTAPLFEVEPLQLEEDVNASHDAVTVLTMLNSICFRAFRPTEFNLKFINARLKEKYSLEDFKKVIEYKNREWSAKPEMKEYLQPSTLFGNKFDQYLNQASGSETLSQAEEDALIAKFFPGA